MNPPRLDSHGVERLTRYPGLIHGSVQMNSSENRILCRKSCHHTEISSQDIVRAGIVFACSLTKIECGMPAITDRNDEFARSETVIRCIAREICQVSDHFMLDTVWTSSWCQSFAVQMTPIEMPVYDCTHRCSYAVREEWPWTLGTPKGATWWLNMNWTHCAF